jgi:hypothetical protein
MAATADKMDKELTTTLAALKTSCEAPQKSSPGSHRP